MTERRMDWLTTGAILIVSTLYRIPFRAEQLFHEDSYRLAAGVMYTLTAHPPGFIGYCALVRLAYLLGGDVNLAFVIVNVLATGIATALTYLLGRHMFGRAEGVIAAVIYATSLDVSYFAEVALTYAAEGAFATAAGLAAWMSVKRRSFGWLIVQTVILAVGGSVRQTTLAFLFPLWLYVLWRSAPRWRERIAAVALLVVIVWSWSVPNARRLAKYWDQDPNIGYFESLYSLQVAMKQFYDSSSFGRVDYEREVPRLHWPLVELAVATWNEIDPPDADARIEIRNASATNALRMIRYQVAKLLFYSTVAMGLATFFVFAALLPRVRSTFGVERTRVLLLWTLPAAAFFAFNHFGAWGYLLIFLASLSVIAARAIAMLRARVAVTVAIALVNVAAFLLMRPLPEISDRNRIINIALLQYGAQAIRLHYARSRASAFTSDPRQLHVDCVSDECLERQLPRDLKLPRDLEPVKPFAER